MLLREGLAALSTRFLVSIKLRDLPEVTSKPAAKPLTDPTTRHLS